MKDITTREELIELCDNTTVPQEILDTFHGMDLLLYMNELFRIVENMELTNVKSYSYRLTAPRLFNYLIGYYVDLHNVQLKINKNWLKQGKDEEWWQERLQQIMKYVASYVERIYYMNEYEEKQKHLARMRAELDQKGLNWCDDEEYRNEYDRKLKYENPVFSQWQ